MARIGKYSSANETTPQPKMTGTGGASGLKTQFDTMEPRQRPAPGYVGAAKDPTLKRGMSVFSKK